ncbi:MAG: enoyl-CoA hydratase-related protein [Vulcanimicrobiaceae bacterium]
MRPSSLAVRRVGHFAHVELDRPDVRNAFDAASIAEIDEAFTSLSHDPSVRGIVLSGAGALFCGGADIAWMRASLDLSDDENRADARAMSRMFRAIDRSPVPVIARVHGAAMGGGVGLVAVADIAIASSETLFAFSETKLGILPAVISPFVLAKIGRSHARALALTGERFRAPRALAIGLVHEVVATPSDLDAAIDRVCAEIASASPTAIAATKALFADVAESDYDATLELTSRAIARQRTSVEGQDGLRAFLEKRPPAWAR